MKFQLGPLRPEMCSHMHEMGLLIWDEFSGPGMGLFGFKW